MGILFIVGWPRCSGYSNYLRPVKERSSVCKQGSGRSSSTLGARLGTWLPRVDYRYSLWVARSSLLSAYVLVKHRSIEEEADQGYCHPDTGRTHGTAQAEKLSTSNTRKSKHDNLHAFRKRDVITNKLLFLLVCIYSQPPFHNYLFS